MYRVEELVLVAARRVADGGFDLFAGIIGNLVGGIIATGNMLAHFIDDIINHVIDLIDSGIDDIVDLVNGVADPFLGTVKQRHCYTLRSALWRGFYA